LNMPRIQNNAEIKEVSRGRRDEIDVMKQVTPCRERYTHGELKN
jgi:hypothetical protein